MDEKFEFLIEGFDKIGDEKVPVQITGKGTRAEIESYSATRKWPSNWGVGNWLLRNGDPRIPPFDSNGEPKAPTETGIKAKHPTKGFVAIDEFLANP